MRFSIYRLSMPHLFPILILAVLLAPPTRAAPQPPSDLSARYDVIARGVAVADYRLRLRYPEPGRFEATTELKPKGMLALFNKTTVRETATGIVQNGQFLPERYTREKTRSKDDRTDVTEFLRAQGTVRMRFQNKDSEHSLPENGLDALSFHLALMADAAQGRIRPAYTLADRGRIKTYTLTDEGEARIDTGLGSLNIHKLAQRSPGDDRYTVFGLAPALGYAPVMIARYKGGELDTRIVIQSRD